MNESMIDVIQKLKDSELKAENQRKELNFVKKEITDLKSEISHRSINKLQELKNVSIRDLKSLWLKQVESTHLEKNENRLVCVMLPELKNQNLVEKSVLEGLRLNIWQERRDFCDQVRSFTDQHGFLASTRPRKFSISSSIIKPKLEQNDEELNCIENDIAELEETLRQSTLKCSDWKNQEEETKKEIDRLWSQTSDDEELANLETSLQYHQNLTAKLELQCASLRRECDSQEMLSSLMKTAEKTANSDSSATKTPKKTQSFKPESSSTPHPSSIHSPRPESSLSHARQMGHHAGTPQPLRQGLQMARQTNVPTLFQFKTPSAVSLRLMASKNNSASLERQMTSYFNSPSNPETEKPSCTTMEGNIEPIAFTANTSRIDYKPNQLPKRDVKRANSTLNVSNAMETPTDPYERQETPKSCIKPIQQAKPLKSILKKPSVRQPFIS